MRQFIYLSILLFIAVFPAGAGAAQPKQIPLPPDISSPLAETIYRTLIGDSLPPSGSDKWRQESLLSFYDRRNYESVWLNAEANPKRKIEPFSEAFAYGYLDGLDPRHYKLEVIASRPLSPELPAIALRDLQLTNALLHYVSDMNTGRINPQKVFPKLFLSHAKPNLSLMLEEALNKPPSQLVDYFTSIAPQHPEYRKLKQSLAQYRAIEKQDNWERIPDGKLIKPGDTDARLPKIRERLAFLGWFSNASNKPLDGEHANAYDHETEQAIRSFQQYRAAKVDGIIGPETLGQLNISITDRVNQIILTMERWRWLPEHLGEKYLMVNIAGFYATGVENGTTVVHTPVIVGEVAHQTPNFSSTITNVKFYPDWTVPSSIAKRYLLQKIQKKPKIIHALGYEIFHGNKRLDWNEVDIGSLRPQDFPPYQFRQKPGPQNALGLVRFSIENNYSIYLHDTPNDSLFDHNVRTFSSGCIRVGKPVQLAQFILAGQSDLSLSDIEGKFNVPPDMDLKTHIIPLANPLPTYLVYMTAWYDETGVLHFGQDIYGRDSKLLKALVNDN